MLRGEFGHFLSSRSNASGENSSEKDPSDTSTFKMRDMMVEFACELSRRNADPFFEYWLEKWACCCMSLLSSAASLQHHAQTGRKSTALASWFVCLDVGAQIWKWCNFEQLVHFSGWSRQSERIQTTVKGTLCRVICLWKWSVTFALLASPNQLLMSTQVLNHSGCKIPPKMEEHVEALLRYKFERATECHAFKVANYAYHP